MLTIGYTLIDVERTHSKGKGKGILIGDKLRPLLEKIQASERELARQIGVSPTAVYKWKTNKSGITWEQLQALSESLGVSINYFLEEKSKVTGRGYYIGDQLKKVMEEKGLTQYALAKKSGIPQSMLSAYIHNKRGISKKNLKKLAQAIGVPESYFIEDEPPKQYPPTPEVVEREYIAIPIITGVGAGGEVITDDYTIIRRSQLPRKSLSAFEVRGDSMEPTIPKGWIVLIDPDDRKLQNGKIYLFASSGGSDENGLLIRRVFKQNEEWMMVPDNRKYEPEKLTDAWKVVGRAVKKMPKMELENVD